ncbi:MAG: heme exporter protein CcmD [Methylicorpusculum sp.]|jgi:heme exporter protein D|uniref:heme exporter protein CcmD n=1 Tax=Methylicorpusculum sp. TaxID=2713644 RepID=UPI00271DE033|nr:heme exporter protein CcmD [Methylicorpusculum sp.]MDO8844490.1 heme exporter protein CcmD [Methylicorpusculum sp.]MDO8939718.1 heme exporter protein CcmD [Methylicorpusculum sp.]MDO9239855.1 heme exporter protein CcmD [Methylicorpusculum sp.]MDP2176965.1 heme exporter protein CcmD [Methylicorpusculum sp.]MDP2204598.1 heme exporter protein CcmD [Methylicorpusculum sp.]
MSDFWHMGGYAFYVWTSYGIGFLVLIIGLIKPLMLQKKILRELVLKRQRNQRVSKS